MLQPLPGQVSRDSFAAIELLDAAADFGVDELAIIEQPTIQLLLGIEQPPKRFFGRSRTRGLHLLLKTSFQSCVVDFDNHGLDNRHAIPYESQDIGEYVVGILGGGANEA